MWEYPIARAWADFAGGSRIYGGTNEIMRNSFRARSEPGMPMINLAMGLERARSSTPRKPAVHFADRLHHVRDLDAAATRSRTGFARWALGRGDNVALGAPTCRVPGRHYGILKPARPWSVSVLSKAPESLSPRGPQANGVLLLEGTADLPLAGGARGIRQGAAPEFS